MKRINLLTYSAVALAFILLTSAVHVDTFKVDVEKSSVKWYAQKVGGKHNGTIKFKEGELRNDHGNYSGSFKIDMTTLANSDIEKAESKAKIENHLKSADFFEVEKYPVSTFVITSVTPLAEPDKNMATHLVKGTMTIKDKTNPAEFNTKISLEPGQVICTGEMVIDRSKYDVRYGSKTFFKDIGDKAIDDEFTLKFNLVLVK